MNSSGHVKPSRLWAICVVALALSSAACGPKRIAFLHKFRAESEHGLKDQELEKLQFYVSRDLVLRREVDVSDQKVSNRNHLIWLDGHLVEQIRLREGTPGKVVKIDASGFEMAFERAGTLRFEYLPSVQGQEIIARGNLGDSSSTYRFSIPTNRAVKYAGRTYKVVEGGLGDAGDTYLLIDVTAVSKSENTSRQMPGLKLQ